MKDFRELINIIEQNVLPAPMEPTYRIDPQTGQSVPDIDYKLNPGMKPAAEPSDLPRLDAPMEPTYRKDPRTGQMVPDIDYKLNPQMKPSEPAVKPQSKPVPKAPASGSLPSSSAPKAPSVPRMPTVPAPSQGARKVTETQLDQISEQLVSEIAKTVNVATKKKTNQRKHLRRAAEYRAHLEKNLPQLMKFLDRAVKGWRPSEEQINDAIATAYDVMKHTGDKKQAGKAMMDELNTLHRMSQGQQGVAEGNRFDEPLTGYHIVYKNSGNPVLNTPSFETKDQAQKYLMTKMFANHQDFKVVHTASVGVAEGSLNEFAPDPDSNGNDDSDDPIGDLALAAARRLQVHEMPRNTAIKAMMTDPELIRQLKLLDPDIFHSREEFKGLCVYAIQQVRLEQADDEDGDYDYYYRESRNQNHKKILEQSIAESKQKCWVGYKKQGTKMKNGKLVNNCVKKTNNESKISGSLFKELTSIMEERESPGTCPKCGGVSFSMHKLAEEKDACYYKVKSRYKVWPSAYASGALVKCRKKGAKNWGNKRK